jgi:hypothetical protein
MLEWDVELKKKIEILCLQLSLISGWFNPFGAVNEVTLLKET